MLQFMGWHWPAKDQQAAARVLQQSRTLVAADNRWQAAFQAEGILTYVLRGRHDRAPVRLHSGAGIIIGSLFHNATPIAPTVDECLTRRILHSDGEALIRDYWGNYVTILKSRDEGRAVLLRGPASTLPVFYEANGSIHRFFSMVEASASLERITPEIDWPVFAASLIGPIDTPRTALRGVREILPGHSVHLTVDAAVAHQVWKPVEVAKQLPVSHSSEAALLVRTAVETCTHAFAAGHDRVLHCLSGGLDSSVVLAALAVSPEKRDIYCATYYSDDAEGDERQPARDAVRSTCARLIELQRRDDIDLTRALAGMRTTRPPGLRMPEVDRSEADLADELGATVLLKGLGGDEVFGRNLAIPALAECLRCAPSRKFFDLALHVAVTEGVTFWEMLLQAARQAWFPQRRNAIRTFLREQAQPSLLSVEIIDSVMNDENFGENPLIWPHQSLPGKQMQIGLTTGSRPYGTPHSRTDDVTLCAPLLSQPVIEASLRIPTWFQFENRGERAVLRNAFADVLSPATLRRRTKGGAEILARKILNRNLPFVRELLLEGLLIREHIVDRGRLDRALSDQPVAGSIATAPVFDLLGAEIWLRRWLRT